MKDATPRPARTTTDPKLNKYLERKERRRLDIFLESLKAMLGTKEGRFVIWHWLRRSGIDSTVWSQSGMEVHYNAGQQALGFSLRDDCLAADEELVNLMNRELRAWERQLDTELEARESQSRAEQQEQKS